MASSKPPNLSSNDCWLGYNSGAKKCLPTWLPRMCKDQGQSQKSGWHLPLHLWIRWLTLLGLHPRVDAGPFSRRRMLNFFPPLSSSSEMVNRDNISSLVSPPCTLVAAKGSIGGGPRLGAAFKFGPWGKGTACAKVLGQEGTWLVGVSAARKSFICQLGRGRQARP